MVVFAGWAGIGKTTLGRKYPGLVVDLESTDFKWLGGGSEATKGVPGLLPNPNYPGNYIQCLRAVLDVYPIVCVSMHDDIQEAMEAEGISYVYVFPSPHDKDAYVERYRQRGNAETFCAKVGGNWGLILDMLATKRNESIVLAPNTTLEAYLRAHTRWLDGVEPAPLS